MSTPHFEFVLVEGHSSSMFFLIVRWIKMAFHAVQHATRQWAPELQQLNDHIEKLERSLAGTDDCVLDIFDLEGRHGNRIDALEEELASVKACLLVLTKEFDAHKNVKCPMPEEIKHYFKTIMNRDEPIMDRDEVDVVPTPPPNSPTKGYNLRSHVIDIE